MYMEMCQGLQDIPGFTKQAVGSLIPTDHLSTALNFVQQHCILRGNIRICTEFFITTCSTVTPSRLALADLFKHTDVAFPHKCCHQSPTLKLAAKATPPTAAPSSWQSHFNLALHSHVHRKTVSWHLRAGDKGERPPPAGLSASKNLCYQKLIMDLTLIKSNKDVLHQAASSPWLLLMYNS